MTIESSAYPHLARQSDQYEAIVPPQPLADKIGSTVLGEATQRVTDTVPSVKPEIASEARLAQKAWLERRGLLDVTPYITMSKTAYGLFDLIGSTASDSYSAFEPPSPIFQRAREVCKIPQSDQYAPQYALVDVEQDDSELPAEPLLVAITDKDFGTVVDVDLDDRYFLDPNRPPAPESDGAYAIVDISETIKQSWEGLQTFALKLMDRKWTNPLAGKKFWLRAGDVAPGQEDAFVWENGKALASAVQLTINALLAYPSVCAVVGERQDPINGKSGMCQIKDPQVILVIEGEDLRRLQDVYIRLYKEPDFAVTSAQQNSRNKTFNNYLDVLLSEVVEERGARDAAMKEDRYHTGGHSSQPRAFEMPL